MPTTVLAFAGHMIDAPDRAVPRFPSGIVAAVESALAGFLGSLDEIVAVSSAANGADLLFVQAALRHGAEVHLVLPFERRDFIERSVRPGGTEWLARFDDALRRATSVTVVARSADAGDDAPFDAAAWQVESLALERAAALRVAPLLLCVLDPDAAGAIGGTLGSYRRWTGAGHRAHVVDLRAIRLAASGHVNGP